MMSLGLNHMMNLAVIQLLQKIRNCGEISRQERVRQIQSDYSFSISLYAAHISRSFQRNSKILKAFQ